MLMFLDGQLVRAQLTPVIPGEFRIMVDADAQQAKLYHGFELVESGVIWYGTGCRIDAKSGKIGPKLGKNASIRAVFGGTHLDFTL